MELLLERIKYFRYLYDKNEPNFKDTQMKEARWEMIGKEFGMSRATCEKKWRNARDHRLKIRNKLASASHSGMAAGTTGVQVSAPLLMIMNLLVMHTRSTAIRGCTPVVSPYQPADKSEGELLHMHKGNTYYDNTLRMMKEKASGDTDMDDTIQKTLDVCATKLDSLHQKRDAICMSHGISIGWRLKELPQHLRTEVLHKIAEMSLYSSNVGD
ncbi:uncharacterized protein LOC135384293 [Ornithodoros turicata]|uniref:uncharacterized protein LOC135384293 n=1 Tax=Ornithodoros turicata TaxID=34597 RepID=UPI0031397D82